MPQQRYSVTEISVCPYYFLNNTSYLFSTLNTNSIWYKLKCATKLKWPKIPWVYFIKFNSFWMISVIYMKEADHIPKIILPTEFLQSNFLQAENICTRVNINFMQPVLHRNDVLYKALKCSSTLFYPQPRSAGWSRSRKLRGCGKITVLYYTLQPHCVQCFLRTQSWGMWTTLCLRFHVTHGESEFWGYELWRSGDVWNMTAPPFPQRHWDWRTAHSWGRSQHSSPGHTLTGSAQLRLTTPKLSIPPTASSFAQYASLSRWSKFVSFSCILLPVFLFFSPFKTYARWAQQPTPT